MLGEVGLRPMDHWLATYRHTCGEGVEGETHVRRCDLGRDDGGDTTAEDDGHICWSTGGVEWSIRRSWEGRAKRA